MCSLFIYIFFFWAKFVCLRTPAARQVNSGIRDLAGGMWKQRAENCLLCAARLNADPLCQLLLLLALLNRSIDLWQMRSCWLCTKTVPTVPTAAVESLVAGCWLLAAGVSASPVAFDDVSLGSWAHSLGTVLCHLAIRLHAMLRSSSAKQIHIRSDIYAMLYTFQAMWFDWLRSSSHGSGPARPLACKRFTIPQHTHTHIHSYNSCLLLLICALFVDSLFGLSIAFSRFVQPLQTVFGH